MLKVNFKIFITAFILFKTINIKAQTKTERKGEFYFSWGYNKDWYTHSNVHINQPSLGNNYTFVNIKGHDRPGWDEHFLSQQLTIPQYNYRIGYIFNKEKGLGFEINFDHTKFIFADQQAHIKGTRNSKPIDSVVNFNGNNGFYYFLNNGANFLLFNIVKRWHYYKTKNEKIKIDGFGKAGIGPVIPHVQNAFFGQPNDADFQFGGWNIGLEYAIRGTFFKHIYLEFANKLDYASYSGLAIYKGKARQAFGCYEWILSLGTTFPIGKKITQ